MSATRIIIVVLCILGAAGLPPLFIAAAAIYLVAERKGADIIGYWWIGKPNDYDQW